MRHHLTPILALALIVSAAPALAAPTSTSTVLVIPAATRAQASAAITATGGHITATADRLGILTATIPTGALPALTADPAIAAVSTTRTRLSVQATITQTTAGSTALPWGLDRIDQAALPLDGAYTYASTNTGTGVKVYVVDTGIRATHTDFGGRVAAGYSGLPGAPATSDTLGHGTHVAGVIAGATYGVAKGATLVPVRVFDNKGLLTDLTRLVDALNWIANDHQPGTPAVVNLSFGGTTNTALNAAVQSLIDAGLTVVTAAGNTNADTCATSPGGLANAITVAATSKDDTRGHGPTEQGTDTLYSDYGPCIDLFAPGTAVLSDYSASDTAIAEATGTSMAAPHVSGAAARYLQAHPTATPAQVASALTASATTGKIANPGTNTTNRLLRLPVFYDPATPIPTITPAPAPVLSKPTAPAITRATATSRTTIALAWKPPTKTGNTPLLRYEVRWTTNKTATRWSPWTSARLATTATLHVTDSRTKRYVQVRAINKMGASPAASRRLR